MFLSKISIKNYRLFEDEFTIDNFNVPDTINEGSGLTIIVGENGCGKTTILDSIAITMLDYKADSFNIYDINNLDEEVFINMFSDNEFDVKGTLPNNDFKAIGFCFNGKLRNRTQKNYLLTPIVYDQLYISADPNKPKKNSPDLRLNVNNPFLGKRFSETDILYLDKNRLFQTRAGTYNNTRFDRLMNDFNFQYIRNTEVIEDLNIDLNNKIKKSKIENSFLENAITDFENLSGYKVRLDFIDNYKPFKNSSFVLKEKNNIQIPLSNIGSGFEMIFSLIYSYYLAKQNGKKLIILIDEPELHLHPEIQKKFVNFLLEASKDTQVIMTTHSPILVKQIMYNTYVKSIVIHNNKTISSISDIKLSYLSSNEINYIAFGLATEEYHNELYEELKDKYGSNLTIKKFDNDFFVLKMGEKKDSPYFNSPNEVSIHTFIRNQIHHRKDNGIASYNDIKNSIDFMRTCL